MKTIREPAPRLIPSPAGAKGCRWGRVACLHVEMKEPGRLAGLAFLNHEGVMLWLAIPPHQGCHGSSMTH